MAETLTEDATLPKPSKKRRTQEEIKNDLRQKIADMEAKEREKSKKLLESAIVSSQAFANKYPSSAGGKLALQAVGVLQQALKSGF